MYRLLIPSESQPLSAMLQPGSFKLSVCISTFNRAAFIGETLDRLIAQATKDCEIVVLDGASTDETERVVTEHATRFDRLRYVRQDTNNGADRDFDRAVELARGEYCWLMSDDDLLKPGALVAVLKVLRQDSRAGISNILRRRVLRCIAFPFIGAIEYPLRSLVGVRAFRRRRREYA